MSQSKMFPATLMPDDDWWHVLWPNPFQVISDVGIREGMDIIDLCCGDGYFTKPMCEISKSGQIYGLDLDDDLLAKAEKACEDFDNFQSISCDARDLSKYLNNLVDFVLIANTFHGVPDQLSLLKSIYKTLKQSGRFVVINWYKRPREETKVLGQPRGPRTELRMQPEDLQRVVEPAGFVVDKIVDVGPYHYGVVFCKSTNTSE